MAFGNLSFAKYPFIKFAGYFEGFDAAFSPNKDWKTEPCLEFVQGYPHFVARSKPMPVSSKAVFENKSVLGDFLNI